MVFQALLRVYNVDLNQGFYTGPVLLLFKGCFEVFPPLKLALAHLPSL